MYKKILSGNIMVFLLLVFLMVIKLPSIFSLYSNSSEDHSYRLNIYKLIAKEVPRDFDESILLVGCNDLHGRDFEPLWGLISLAKILGYKNTDLIALEQNRRRAEPNRIIFDCNKGKMTQKRYIDFLSPLVTNELWESQLIDNKSGLDSDRASAVLSEYHDPTPKVPPIFDSGLPKYIANKDRTKAFSIVRFFHSLPFEKSETICFAFMGHPSFTMWVGENKIAEGAYPKVVENCLEGINNNLITIDIPVHEHKAEFVAGRFWKFSE